MKTRNKKAISLLMICVATVVGIQIYVHLRDEHQRKRCQHALDNSTIVAEFKTIFPDGDVELSSLDYLPRIICETMVCNEYVLYLKIFIHSGIDNRGVSIMRIRELELSSTSGEFSMPIEPEEWPLLVSQGRDAFLDLLPPDSCTDDNSTH